MALERQFENMTVYGGDRTGESGGAGTATVGEFEKVKKIITGYEGNSANPGTATYSVDPRRGEVVKDRGERGGYEENRTSYK